VKGFGDMVSLATMTSPGGTTVQTPTAPSIPSPTGLGNRSYLASAIKEKASSPAPTPSVPTYDFSRDAERGTEAMNLARTVAGMGQQAVANSTFKTGPGGTGSPSTMPTYGPNRDTAGNPIIKTNEERLAGYTPEVVQGMYGGNEYAVTSAGLEAPDRSKFASNEDYLRAADTYNKLVLMEQDTEANSQARQYADIRNAEQAATDEMRRRVAAADAAQKEVARKNANERILLANQLAARGLDPNTDTWALGKIQEADRLDREEQQAAASIASLDMSSLRSAANDAARKALVDRIAAIGAAKKNLVDAEAKANRINSDLLLAQARDENYQSQVDYRKSEAERKAAESALKAERNPALVALDEARANKLITDAEYTAGVRSLNMEADTALKKANTERITTLLPEQLAKMRAEVAKLKRVGAGTGGGGSAGVTDEEIIGAQKLFQEQGGTGIASGKVLASAINLYRATNGQPDNLVEEATAGKAEYKAKTSTKTVTGDTDW